MSTYHSQKGIRVDHRVDPTKDNFIFTKFILFQFVNSGLKCQILSHCVKNWLAELIGLSQQIETALILLELQSKESKTKHLILSLR